MKKMKKILSLVLALVMCLSLVNLSAFAEETTEPEVFGGDTPVVNCTKSEDCTAETHEEGCPKYAVPVVTCTKSDDCTAETHEEGCPKYAAPVVTCTKSEDCAAETHEEGCPKYADPSSAVDNGIVTAEEEPDHNCFCSLKCLEDNIKETCPACTAEGADLDKVCKGAEREENTFTATFEQYEGEQAGTLIINGAGKLTRNILDQLTFTWTDALGQKHEAQMNHGGNIDVHSMIKKLVIGEGITALDECLFDSNLGRNLVNLQEVVLPESLTQIGDNAFRSCYNLQTINFPAALESIGTYAFSSCRSLKSVVIDSPDVVIGLCAFWSCSYLETISIAGAKKIDECAFQACYSLKSVTLENIDQIGLCILSGNWEEDGYEYFGGPESLTIKNVKTISDYAFQACESLKTVSLENVETVGQDAFFQCYALEHADLTDVGTLMGFVFEQTALKSVNMNKVGTINRNAFWGNTDLVTVKGLDTVERIDGFAFYGCSNLKGLTVADATKMGFNGDNYADVMERVQAILDGKFTLDDATAIAELTPDAGWDDGKVGKSENWNTYNHGTQLMEQARWTNGNKTEAEVEVTSYYTGKQQMDYVFVVDLSASMAQLGNLADKNARFYDMQSKMLDMTDKLLNAPGYDCQVAFVTFGGAVVYNNGNVDPAISETIPFTADADTAASAIRAMEPLNQNTDYGLAMEKTLDLVKGHTDRNTTVIFMSDGQPVVDGETNLTTATLPSYRNKIAAKADEIEALGINIYGVLHSVTETEHDNAVLAMKAVCSDGLFFEANNTEEFSKSVNAALTAANGGSYTVTIPVNADFENVQDLTPSNTDDEVSVKDGTITWTITGMPFTKHTLTYKMSLTAENAAKYGDQSYAVNDGNAVIAGGASVTSPVLTRSVSAPITPTYYTLTINYVDEDGNEVATRYSRSYASGYNYSVTSPIVDGMTPDQDVVSGRLTRNTTITVTYGSGVPTTDIPDGNVPLASVDDKLNTTDHFAYIIGYPEGDVRPNANITRAEAVTVFFRLMTEEFRAANWSSENTYPDVEASQWFNNAISTASKAGIFQGDETGNARPNDAITRAEFAALAARFISDQITDDGTGDFADTADHWAAKEIRLAVKAGWIKGVGGNKFEPDRSITRAEVMTIVNRMLDRVADKDHMLSDMKVWSDNMDTSVWYYADVQEATNGHDYERVEGELTETWTKLQAPRDWAALEKEWSTAESGK